MVRRRLKLKIEAERLDDAKQTAKLLQRGTERRLRRLAEHDADQS